MSNILTNPQKIQLIVDYQSGMAQRDIFKKYGLTSAGVMYNILKDANIPLRCPNRAKNKPAAPAINAAVSSPQHPPRTDATAPATTQPTVKKIKCHKCGNTEHLPDAKFCCKCGAQILTPKEVIIKQLEALTEYDTFIKASSARDDFIKEINAIINGVKELNE